ncbi:MAG: aldo/keto reductase family protein [Planctomycetota bacterium]
MNYRRLGKAGIRVSEIGLGSWLTFGGGVDGDVARECVRRAYDLGINFFDTADVYNFGAAEECYGEELSEFRRADLVIATKLYFPMSAGINDRGLSRKHIFESVHASLKRLRTDYIDLYQCHRYDEDVEVVEVARAMDDLIRQGKVLYWGVSEWPAAAIDQACESALALNAYAPISNQPEYSIAARRVETDGVQATCREKGLGMVVWSPLKQGILTGKYSGGQVPSDSRAAHERMSVFLKDIDRDLADRVDALRPIAEKHGMTLAQLAIAWLLKRESVSSVIIGATRVAQVEENAAATGFDLTPDDLAQIDKLFPAEEYP